MNLHFFIPALVIILPFVFVVILIWIQSRENSRRDRLRADMYMKAIEKGEKIPVDIFPSKKEKPLRTAVILIFVAIAIPLVMYLENGNIAKAISGGIIPFFLGLGFLVIHFMEKSQSKPGNGKR